MAFGIVLESAFLTLTGDFEAFKLAADTTAVVITLNPGEKATIQFNIDSGGTTDDIDLAIWQGHLLDTGNALDGAASSTDVQLDTGADPIATDDDLNGTYIHFTSSGAAEEGEVRLITDSVATADRALLSHALSGTPSATETYDRYAFDHFAFTIDATTAIGNDNPMSRGITVYSANGEKVVIVARTQGTPTDTHRMKISYQVDGVSV